MSSPLRLLGLALLLGLAAACGKAPAPAGDPDVNPATAQEEEFTSQNVPETVVPPPPADPAQQAGILAALIDTRPECAEFRGPLEAASTAAPGSTAAQIDMTDIMRRAQAANCARQ
jgi:hypothetical protein